MNYLITESQLKIIVNEQGMGGMFSPQYVASTVNKDLQQMDSHTKLSILQIGTAFIPFVGPFISAGIGLADAAMYYNEGDKKTAGLVGIFSMIPGVGGLASKMGLGKWSAKALGEIGKKISFGSKLTPIESQVANRVAQYKQLIQTEMNKIGKDATIQSGKNAVKKKIAKSNVMKGTKKVGSELGTYAAVGYGYDKGYDKITGQKNFDFDSIDGEPVRYIFLLVGKDSMLNLHIKLLSRISRLMNKDEFRGKLLSSESSEQVLKLFVEEEQSYLDI
jgi:hypothetical protein